MILYQMGGFDLTVPASWLHRACNGGGHITDADMLAQAKDVVSEIFLGYDLSSLSRLCEDNGHRTQHARLKQAHVFITEYRLARYLYERLRTARQPVTSFHLLQKWNNLVEDVPATHRPRYVSDLSGNQGRSWMRRWRQRWCAWMGTLPTRNLTTLPEKSAKAPVCLFDSATWTPRAASWVHPRAAKKSTPEHPKRGVPGGHILDPELDPKSGPWRDPKRGPRSTPFLGPKNPPKAVPKIPPVAPPSHGDRCRFFFAKRGAFFSPRTASRFLPKPSLSGAQNVAPK